MIVQQIHYLDTCTGTYTHTKCNSIIFELQNADQGNNVRKNSDDGSIIIKIDYLVDIINKMTRNFQQLHCEYGHYMLCLISDATARY